MLNCDLLVLRLDPDKHGHAILSADGIGPERRNAFGVIYEAEVVC